MADDKKKSEANAESQEVIHKISRPEIVEDLSPDLEIYRLEDKDSSKQLVKKDDKKNAGASESSEVRKISGPEIAPELSPDLAIDRLEDRVSSKKLEKNEKEVAHYTGPGAYAVTNVRASPPENISPNQALQGNAQGEDVENNAPDYANYTNVEENMNIDPQPEHEKVGKGTKLGVKDMFRLLWSDKRNRYMSVGLVVISILIFSAVIYGAILVTQTTLMKTKDPNTDSKGNVYSNISVIIYSRNGVTANAISKDTNAQKIVGRTLLQGIASAPSSKTTSVSAYSFVRASEALKGTSFSVLTYELEIKSSDHNSTAIQEAINGLSSSGELTTIVNQLDTNDEFGFWIEHITLTAIYDVAMTIQYECTSKTDLAKEKGVDAALKQYHEHLNDKFEQGFEHLSITNVVVTSGECKDYTDSRGTQYSRIEYHLPVTCTGSCPSQGIPPIDSINRRRQLVELFNDAVPELKELIKAFESNTKLKVIDAQTDLNGNGLIGCRDKSKCPSFTKFWRTMSSFDIMTNDPILLDLSSNGDTLVTGYQGSNNTQTIKAYERNQNYRENELWTQIINLNLDEDKDSAFGIGARFDVSIAESGNVVAIGEPYYNGDQGVVQVYYKVQLESSSKTSDSNWLQKGQDLRGDSTNDNFGVSVDLANNGNTLLVGADMSSQEVGQGYAKVYDFQGDTWALRGNSLIGKTSLGLFGGQARITEDGLNICVSGSDYISCYNWTETENTWKERGSTIEGDANSRFGDSLALSKQTGNTLVVGSNREMDVGTGHIYEFDGKGWNKTYTSNYGNYSGHIVDVSKDGSIAVIGGDALNSLVHVYRRENDEWVTMGASLPGGQKTSISLSSGGNYLAIGVPPSEGEDSGKTTVYEWIP